MSSPQRWTLTQYHITCVYEWPQMGHEVPLTLQQSACVLEHSTDESDNWEGMQAGQADTCLNRKLQLL